MACISIDDAGFANGSRIMALMLVYESIHANAGDIFHNL
tara:strand:- start:117 stop:233 length:117 start_codon:yes stop_codon:yes gene_type:complete